MVLDELIRKAHALKSSDIHLLTGLPAYCRNKTGEMIMLSDEVVANTFLEDTFMDKLHNIHENGDVDIAYSVDDIRTRINVFKEERGLSAVIRILDSVIPSMSELRLPMSVQHLIKKRHGLILFTAATGNGKTTSIAAMLKAINQTQRKRIIMIEEPIEYLHQNEQSIFSQREVGRDVPDFATGLRSALRENPDVIMIGEMRDRDTVIASIAAAESGHLVFSTLHSADVIQATDRILQYFNSKEQESIQSQFANAFEAVIAQKLIPRKDGTGRIAAFEVLLKTDATRAVIRNGQGFNLHSYMTLKEGMQTMDYSISELRRKGIIS